MVFRVDELISLKLTLVTIIQQLSDGIHNRGTEYIFTNMKKMVDIFGEMEKSFHQGSSEVKNEVLQLLMQIMQMFQKNITNAGSLAALSSIIVRIQSMQQIQTTGVQSEADVLTGCQQSLESVLDAHQSDSSTGGMIDDQDAIKYIFMILQMMKSEVQNGNMKQVVDHLKQIQFLMQGIKTQTTNKSTVNLLESLSINLNMTLQRAIENAVNSSDVINLNRHFSNVLSQAYVSKDTSGAAHFNSKTGGDTSKYLQQISVIYRDIRNSLSKNDMSSVQTQILELLEIFIRLQSVVSGVNELNALSNTMLEMNEVQKQMRTKSISSIQILPMLSHHMNDLNQVIDMTSVNGDVSTTSITTTAIKTVNTKISNIETLIQNFTTLVSSGNMQEMTDVLNEVRDISTYNFNSLLSNGLINHSFTLNQQLLIEITSLQSTVRNKSARNKMLSIIGNIYAVQKQMSEKNVSDDDFTFLITNIQDGLKKISKIVNSKSSTLETTNISTNAENVGSTGDSSSSTSKRSRSDLPMGGLQGSMRAITDFINGKSTDSTSTGTTMIIRDLLNIKSELMHLKEETSAGRSRATISIIISKLEKLIESIQTKGRNDDEINACLDFGISRSSQNISASRNSDNNNESTSGIFPR